MLKPSLNTRPVVDRSSYKTKTKDCGKESPPPPSLPPIRGGGERGGLSLQKLKEVVKSLPKKDRDELHSYLHLIENSSQAEQDRFLDMFTDSLLLAISKKLGTTKIFIMPSQKRNLKKCSEYVKNFLASVGWTFHSTGETKVLLNFCCELLVAGTHGLSSKMAKPLGLNFVLQQGVLIAAYFDKAFPGYLDAGLAMKILEEKIKQS